MADATRNAWLVPVGGPEIAPLQLPARPAGVTLGRSETSDVQLPQNAETVSRTHCRFIGDADAWRLGDMNSRWGTFLNGVKLTPQQDVPLSEGDLIRINPWTFAFSLKGPARRGLKSINDLDTGQTLVRHVAPAAVSILEEDMLSLLLESAAGIHAATSEKQLAELVLDEACRGTGLTNAALLKPLDASGTLEIVASRMPAGSGGATYSRSLIAAASQGNVAEISGASSDNISQSIVQMKIDTALCVPLMLGQTVAAYLYLDTRRQHGPPQHMRPNAAAFCMALGRMASLALSNLKRQEIEKRQAAMEKELSAAAVAQKWILPKRVTQLCGCTCIGESRPGAYVGGDFFDLIELGESKLAVTLGDVTGHGIPASVLMTASQGFLHAALLEHGDPARALLSLNSFISPRRSDERFVTLWVGVFDLANKTLTYVDAGHGYAMMLQPDGRIEPLSEGGGVPIGVLDTPDYSAQSIALTDGQRALIVSDGIVEQHGPVTSADGATTLEQFSVRGVRNAISEMPKGADEVETLFKAVIAHAGATALQDDATAVLLRW